MRIAGYAVSVMLAATLLGAQDANQDRSRHGAAEETKMFATNRCLSKGGLGIVNTSLYVDVKSTKNELLFGEKETWSGLDASKAEVVVFFQDGVWMPQSLPKGFDLSRAIVVSFERGKIRFFDFQTMSGGYYDRLGS
jgi:hypothetical protein